eukprot:CAMPEP_0197841178 /NCGR_PEP_ID=MMETSP1437-20131217/46029_1 /TAXON_ID=49252 ORGANISM="Eucampia antarctica, Strain CCMP1452" /NCGR_SAMPLE_ID=MMETSP1437 /ASSEMBLY_ACC=CAM_ASM_001096 /LENGTH=347 /DNA_ID=CAMNT_0043450895 /DNA_START=328 /DNA_END=1372 /DNA_ORIENTATION=-
MGRGGGGDDTYIHNTDKDKEERYGSLPPTVFAPDGRLYMVERKARDACDIYDASSPLVVSMKFDKGIIIISTPPTSPHAYHPPNDDDDDDDDDGDDGDVVIPLLLNDDDSQLLVEDPMSIVSPTLVVATGGNAVDSCILLQRVLSLVASLLESYSGGAVWSMSLPSSSSSSSSSLKSAWVARKVADMLQLPTQSVGTRAGRLLASSVLVVGCDDNNNNSDKDGDYNIWRIDPTGQFWNCQAAAIGRGAGTVESEILRRTLSSDDNDNNYWETISCQEALTLACQCIMKSHDTTENNNKNSNRPMMMQGIVIRHNNNINERKIEVVSSKTLQKIIESSNDSTTTTIAT